ncbi:MAG: glycosyltransferase family 2 protein [Gluconacetobacter diazotrophicus]|nr:glycosyltransferase family 2 protein [Gluconacetobacter diazotrophicus]
MKAGQPPGEALQISIILCTCGRAESCARTVAAIGQIEVPAGLTCELALVQNGPLDPAETNAGDTILANGIVLRTYHEAQTGKSWALNTGLARARGDIFVFTDDDIIPPPDWLEKLTGPIRRGEADGVAGDVRIPPHLDPHWLPPAQRAWLADMGALALGNSGRMVGGNMACSRSVLKKVVGFDVELGPGGWFGYGEDTLFSEQLRNAGFRIVDVLDATVEHHFLPRRLERENWLQAARKMGRTDAYFSHHWWHAQWSHPYWALVKATLRLAVCRLHSRARMPVATDPALPRLADATRHFAACLQYLAERNRPVRHIRRNSAQPSAADRGTAADTAAASPHLRANKPG